MAECSLQRWCIGKKSPCEAISERAGRTCDRPKLTGEVKWPACCTRQETVQCRTGEGLLEAEKIERVIAEAIQSQALQRIAQVVPRVERGDGKPQRGWAFGQVIVHIGQCKRAKHGYSVIHDGPARIDGGQTPPSKLNADRLLIRSE